MAAKREKGDRILVPVVKWVGGKRQLLKALDPLLPERIGIYCEPFVGGGAMLFHLQPEQAYVNDVNAELINLYEVIRDDVDGLLLLLNTVGGDIEAGLAIAEMIAGMKKPTVSLVLGGGHSIGVPLACSAKQSFIAPSATMTVHPVRHSGMVLGVPQTLRYFEQMQERIVSFVTEHSKITARRFTQLMHNTGELVMDMGTVLDGRRAVKEKLIDELGGLSDALAWLYKEIERG